MKSVKYCDDTFPLHLNGFKLNAMSGVTFTIN